MRNADITDIKWLSTGVMYLIDHKWFGPFKAHINQAMTLDDGWIDPWLVETAEGSLLVVERSWIKPVPRKQGSPKKQKHVCKKGTKPNLSLGVPYDSTLAIPGAKAVCRDGNIYDIIDRKNYTDSNKQYTTDSFHKQTGKHVYNLNQYDILRIIVEENKPETVTDNTVLVDYDPKLIAPGVRVKCRDGEIRTISNVVEELRGEWTVEFSWPRISGVDLETGTANYIRKTPHPCDIMKIFIDQPKQDPYNGYFVGEWHFWDGKSSKAPVNCKVKVWFRMDMRGSEDDLLFGIDASFIGSYTPTQDAIALNLSRINERLEGMKK